MAREKVPSFFACNWRFGNLGPDIRKTRKGIKERLNGGVEKKPGKPLLDGKQKSVDKYNVIIYYINT